MFRARTRVAPPVVMLAFAVGIFGCGGGAAAPAPAEASTQKRPKRKQKALYPKVRAPMPSLEDEVPAAPGTLVRVFRRPVTSGVIEVMDERVADQTTAQERTAALVAQGWRPWPPWPAPELASALADAHPGLKECPYLLAASDEPKDLLVRPDRTVTCFESVAQMEEALEREAVIRFHQGQAVPCVELRSIKIKDLKQARVRALMHRCRAMGIVVEARGTKIERGREVRRRTKRNRAPTKPIKPATR